MPKSGWGPGLPRVAKILIVAVVLLLAVEGAIRLRSDALPPPLKWATPDMDRKVEQMRDLADRGGVSVLFLGSSTVDGSIDPSLMTLDGARPAYNGAVRGGTIRMVSGWATRQAVPLVKPAAVVLGVASRELNANDDRQQAREDAFFDAPAVRALRGDESALERAERILESASAIFKYRTRIRDPQYLKAFVGLGEAPSVTQSPFGDYIADDGQFLSFLRRPYNAATFLAEEPQRSDTDPEHIAVLRELLDFLKRNAKTVLVVNMPVTEDYITSRADHDRFSRLLRAEVDRAGVRYIRPGIWPRTFFADPVHVNTKGSQRLTKLVEQELERAP